MTTPAKISKEVSDLLTPKDLEDHPDPLEGTTAGLVPDELRGGEEEEDELKPAKDKTPASPAKVELSFSGLTLGEWLEKQTKDQTEKAENEKLEREIESRKVEDENEEIKESFRRLATKDDLTPNHYKDQE